MRVTFVNRFYWPTEPATAQLLTDLAEGLAAAGATVRVFTGRTAPGLPDRESRHGVEIIRLGPEMRATPSLLHRGLAFARFRSAAATALAAALQPRELLVALTDPPLLGVTAARAAQKSRARLVHWVHDIYPEVFHAVAPGPFSWLARRLLTPARDAAWRDATACVTLGRDMASVVAAAGVDPAHLHVIPNWAPAGLAPAAPADTLALRRAWGLAPADFVVGYSGNLGRVHDLDGLLEVAETLRADARVVFLFIGGGAAFARLQAAAQKRGLTHVRFLPPQPRAQLAVALGVPDVHVVSLREGCERFVFPSKLYGVAAAARPVLALAPPGSELSRLVGAEELGAAFRPTDTGGIASFLRELATEPYRGAAYATAAQRFHAQHDWPRALAAWSVLLQKLDAAS